MFKVMVKVANVWVYATQAVPRSQARRLARFYRVNPNLYPNVHGTKVVRVESK